MNHQEVVDLCRTVKAFCPAQQFDEATPEAWSMLLLPYRFMDAKQAVANLATRLEFIPPKDIVTEIKRIREDRITRAPVLNPPPDLSEIEYRRWLKRTREAIADGEPVPELEEAPKRDLRALPSTFRTIDGEDAG